MSQFQDTSYAAHAKHLEEILEYEGEKSPFFELQNKGSINYWRHERMYSVLLPFLSDPNSTWLTVGDGCAWDANYIYTQGHSVHASDLSDVILSEAAKKGFIKDFSAQNAEKLAFPDGHFDYVFCKEAYHHFPRPFLAVYEMLRVAKKGIIFLEPQDPLIKSPLVMLLKNTLDRIHPQLINKVWKNRFSFETVGNYVYKISDREMEKIAMGMNLPLIAFWGMNDTFEFHPKMFENTKDAAYFSKIKSKIGFRDFLCKIGLIPYKQLGCMLFKQKPNEKELDLMKKQGFQVVVMAKNPYI
jgi:ubiquinone/menaquinone biosynthesis C-methylase UbiE